MRKYLFVIIMFVLLFLTGCSGEYNLVVKDQNLNEQITMNIYSSDHIPQQYENDQIDMASEFLDDEYYAFFNSYNKTYKKQIINHSSYKTMILNYKFDMKNFSKSYYVNNCFSKQKMVSSKKYYYVSLGGYFYCLYGEKFDIKVKSYNKVLSNNADDVNGKTYIWHINKKNYKNTNIQIKLSKRSIMTNILIYCSILIVLLLIVLALVLFFKKQNNRNKI